MIEWSGETESGRWGEEGVKALKEEGVYKEGKRGGQRGEGGVEKAG